MTIRKLNRKAKIVLLLCSLAVILAIGISTTLSFLHTETNDVENTFQPSEVKCEVVEKFSGNKKTEVKIKNTGDTTAYLRATVLVNWMKKGTEEGLENDEFLPNVPQRGVDYEIAYGQDKDINWIQGKDGFWYYIKPVEPNGETSALIDTVTAKNSEKDGYNLTVEIICTAIQASPSNAVLEAWKPTVSNVNGNTLEIIKWGAE